MDSDPDKEDQIPNDGKGSGFSVPHDVIRLGVVSMLTDLSSEMIFSIFAIYFVTVAGGSAALLGMVEGIADFSAASLNYLSGWLSDRSGKRKIFALAGYSLSTLAKIILPATSSVTGLSVFRTVERLGKGLRGPPRDAWLSAVAQQQERGYAFGVHKALDKTGAIVGPLAACGLLWLLGDRIPTYHILFWIALIPALLSIGLLARINDRPAKKHTGAGLTETWGALGQQFKRYLVSAGIFSLAYFSFSFLLLRAHGVGFNVTEIILLYALFNLSFVIAAPLAGKLGDRIGRPRIILLSYLIYLLMCLGFAFADAKWQVITLFVIYGVFYAIDEAQSKAFIADIELHRRASAIGIYNFLTGLIYLPASMIAGGLWLIHPAMVFIVAAVLASCAIIAFLVLRPDLVRITDIR